MSMCRLAFCNREYFGKHTSLEWLQFFDDLEASMGGDGNGAAMRTRNNEIVALKGVKITTEQVVRFWIDGYNSGAQEFLFHTRIVSAGQKCDGNCHPFSTRRSALAHNGHDHRASRLARAGESDTAWIARALFTQAIEVADLPEFSGTYVGWYRGVPFASASDYGACHIARTTTGWLIASEIPPYIRSDALTHDDAFGYFFWGNSQEINGVRQYMAPRPAKVHALVKKAKALVPYSTAMRWEKDALYYHRSLQTFKETKREDAFDSQWIESGQSSVTTYEDYDEYTNDDDEGDESLLPLAQAASEVDRVALEAWLTAQEGE